MATEIFITDQRMLQVMAWAISDNVAGVIGKMDWCDKVGLNWRNLNKIASGNQSFTKEQLLTCAEVFGIDMNWIFGFSATMIRAEQLTPMELMKSAMHAMRQHINELEDAVGSNSKPAKITLKKQPKPAPDKASGVIKAANKKPSRSTSRSSK